MKDTSIIQKLSFKSLESDAYLTADERAQKEERELRDERKRKNLKALQAAQLTPCVAI